MGGVFFKEEAKAAEKWALQGKGGGVLEEGVGSSSKKGGGVSSLKKLGEGVFFKDGGSTWPAT